MADRRRQIEQLLATRYDALPGPTVPKPTPAGLTPAAVERCPHCGGTGRTTDRFNRPTHCTRCNGTGRLAYDPMDALHVPIGSTATTATARPRKTIRCDACDGHGAHGNGQRCRVCDGDGHRELHAFELRIDTDTATSDVLDRWQKALDARNDAGSYRELEQALAGIRVHVNKPERFLWLTQNATRALRLLDEVSLGVRQVTDLTGGERSLYDLAIAYIDTRMPTPIKVPADVRLNDREHQQHRKRVKGRRASNGAVKARDDEIRRLIRRGVPTQRVAFDFGLSVSQVNRIAGGRAEDDAA